MSAGPARLLHCEHGVRERQTPIAELLNEAHQLVAGWQKAQQCLLAVTGRCFCKLLGSAPVT